MVRESGVCTGLGYGESVHGTEFRELHRYVHAEGFENAGDVISQEEKVKQHLMEKMLKRTSASVYQIRKFLHIEVRGS